MPCGRALPAPQRQSGPDRQHTAHRVKCSGNSQPPHAVAGIQAPRLQPANAPRLSSNVAPQSAPKEWSGTDQGPAGSGETRATCAAAECETAAGGRHTRTVTGHGGADVARRSTFYTVQQIVRQHGAHVGSGACTAFDITFRFELIKCRNDRGARKPVSRSQVAGCRKPGSGLEPSRQNSLPQGVIEPAVEIHSGLGSRQVERQRTGFARHRKVVWLRSNIWIVRQYQSSLYSNTE